LTWSRTGQGLAQLAAARSRTAEELGAVHALDPVEVPRREARLVGLEVADQLPGDLGRRLRALLDPLLDAVLADGPQAVAGGELDRQRAGGLGDGEELDLGRRRARPRAGLGDPRPDGVRPPLNSS
jgi:hypothetical protein